MLPLFLNGQAGLLFAVYYPPAGQAVRHTIIHIPAFAEEMNRSRRMVRTQAQAFAEQGITCLVLDLFGTGDSEGDFIDARWPLWQQDIEVAREWLLQQGAETVSLWGLRLGALLALDHAAHSDWPYHSLILWQLQARGELALKQFLRLRVSADMLQDLPERETVKALLGDLLVGNEAVEVAGYRLSPDFAQALMNIDARHIDLPTGLTILSIEVVTDAVQSLSPVNQKLLTHWQNNGLNAQIFTSAGIPFWFAQDISVLPELVDSTTGNVLGLFNSVEV